jgi:phosphoglycolate phosphatase
MRRFAVAAVAIDLDGTLLDTAPDLHAAVDAMLDELGRAGASPDDVRAWVGKGAEVLVHRALTSRMDGHASPDDFARAYPMFLAHYGELNGRHVREYPGVRDGLQAMRAMGLKLACVTNKPGAFTGTLLERCGLDGFFEVVVAGDTVARKKPDPQPLLYACERLGVAPSRTLAIGDSLNDAQAARAAGMPVLIVPYGYNEGRDAETLDADGIVGSLLEAAALIEPLPA